jgi:hypothetical protein
MVFSALGISIKKDYDKLNHFLNEKASNENIKVVWYDTLTELNKNVKTSELALGCYTYNPQYLCDPTISLSKQNLFNDKETVFGLLTFFHELGHHYAIKYENNDSEYRADEKSLKLFRECFPFYKQIQYLPLIFFVQTKIFVNKQINN